MGRAVCPLSPDLGEVTTLTMDGVYIQYKTDRFDGVQIFEAGNQIVSHIQMRHFKAFDEARLYLRFRYRGKNRRRTTVSGLLAIEQERTTSAQIELGGGYGKRLSRAWHVSFLAEGRIFKETEGFEDYNRTPASAGVFLGGVGIAPERRVSSRMFMDGRIKLLAGGLSGGSGVVGLEAAIGMTWRF